jgi:serine/threonine-protein kinase
MPVLTAEERVGGVLGGKYQLERILGEGGMGVVFEATHTWTSRRVAVKLLHPELSRDKSVAQRFLQEARSAAAIQHPNVVDVLDMGAEADGTVYLVLELLEGEDLASRLARGSMSLVETLNVLMPVMGALASAHDRGIIHRDLKPENIFLHQEQGSLQPKVLDFGLAKVIEQDRNNKTRSGIIMGTPHYLAPEQARADKNLGPPADVWAMGVLLYECISGELPFYADNATGVIIKVCSEDPPPLGERAHVPREIEYVVHRALARDIADRFPDMRALAVALVDAARLHNIPIDLPTGLFDAMRASAPISVPVDRERARSGIVRSTRDQTFIEPPGPRKSRLVIVGAIAFASIFVGLLAAIVVAIVFGGYDREPERARTTVVLQPAPPPPAVVARVVPPSAVAPARVAPAPIAPAPIAPAPIAPAPAATVAPPAPVAQSVPVAATEPAPVQPSHSHRARRPVFVPVARPLSPGPSRPSISRSW